MLNSKPIQRIVFSVVVGVVGGVGILTLRKLLAGTPDPFQESWPLYLHSMSCLAAFAVARKWHQELAAAAGLYLGLAGTMLVLETAEYPMSALIALAIHGFVPALIGSLISFTLRLRSCRIPKSSLHA